MFIPIPSSITVIDSLPASLTISFIFFAFALIVAKVFDAAVKEGGFSISGQELVAHFEAAAQEGDEELEVPEEEAAVLSPNYSGDGPRELEIQNSSKMERNILENLSKRREQLEKFI